jgi:hypothetical protein
MTYRERYRGADHSTAIWYQGNDNPWLFQNLGVKMPLLTFWRVRMLGLMAAKRIRLIIDTTEEIRLGVRLAAMRGDKSPSQVINEILEKHLAEEITDAKKYTHKKKSNGR